LGTFRTTAALAGLVIGAASQASPAAAERAPRDRLPNLVQVAPKQIAVARVVVGGRPRFRLGFASATENRGPGPLTLRGWRASEADPTMQVDQLVARADGSTRRVPSIGFMRYVVHQDHEHWHLVGFQRFALRPVGRSGRGRRDRKTGFCLGDRYRARGATRLPGYQQQPQYTDRCGFLAPRLLEVLVGISTGWGDDYPAQLEGQYIDVTRLRSGRYRLVHVANPAGTIAETERSDNRASVALRLSWPRGRRHKPRVAVLRPR
jgi:hypothetical protein